MYLVWVAGEDVETQRMGCIVIIWFEPSFPVISTNRLSSYADVPYAPLEYMSVRIICSHLCVPDTAVYRFIKAFMHLNFGADLWLQMKAHYGKSEMSCY